MADGSVKIDIKVDDSDAKKKLSGVEGDAESVADEFDDLKDSADDAGKGLKDLGDSADDAGKGFDSADVAIGTFVGNALTQLSAKLVETIGNIAALADETREYREDMAKLDTAFTTNGHSAETAQKTYDSFYRILGESDRTVEAVNHLAAFTQSEEELAQWSEICAGVTARFGDSLPIEGLTEAANETAKVGQVTGPLADALNWAGISEDEFNEKLAACNSEQERAALITSTLNGEYAEAGKEYNKLTAESQAARDATNKMEQAQAALGEAIEPVTTAWNNMKAGAMQWLVDVGLPALQTGWEWILNNIPAVIAIIGLLTTAWLTFGGAQQLVDTWNKIMTASQAALNAVMNANPIGLIVMAIAALVAGFLLLWNNCEGFRNFFIGLWDGIVSVVSTVVEAIVGFFTNLWTSIQEIWNVVATWFNDYVIQPIIGFFTGLWEGIVNAYHTVIDPWIEIVKRISAIIYESVVKPIADFFVGLWDSLCSGFQAAWDFISGIWNVVATWFNDTIIQPVANFFSGMWDGLKNGATNAWNGIKNVFSAVASFFGNIFSQAWEKVKTVFSVGGKIFDGIKDGIVTAFKTVVNAIIRGINKVVKLPFEGINNVLSTLQNITIVGVQPFSWLSWRAPVPQIPELERGGVLKRGQVGLLEGNGAEAVVPLEKNAAWIKKTAEDLKKQLQNEGILKIKSAVSAENSRMLQGVGVKDTGFSDIAQAVGMQTAGINSLASEYRKGSSASVTVPLVLNGRELGRAIVDLTKTENTRTGTSLVFA